MQLRQWSVKRFAQGKISTLGIRSRVNRQWGEFEFSIIAKGTYYYVKKPRLSPMKERSITSVGNKASVPCAAQWDNVLKILSKSCRIFHRNKIERWILLEVKAKLRSNRIRENIEKRVTNRFWKSILISTSFNGVAIVKTHTSWRINGNLLKNRQIRCRFLKLVRHTFPYFSLIP